MSLAHDAAEDAKKALALEPGNDLAHHLMGRWHYEMAGLNAVVRTLVRLLYGTALMHGSYTQVRPCVCVWLGEGGRCELNRKG